MTAWRTLIPHRPRHHVLQAIFRLSGRSASLVRRQRAPALSLGEAEPVKSRDPLS